MPDVEYFIGGGGDKNDFIAGVTYATRIMEDVSKSRDATTANLLCLYRGHEQESKILAEIITKWKSGEYTSIRITGHSWGGQAAMNIVQDLFKKQIPVDELITLDPVSAFPFGKVYAGKWVNVYIEQSLLDDTVGKIPVVGNLINSIITLPTLATSSGLSGGYIANVGGQLGFENGAHNVEMDGNITHANAQAMYDRARKEIIKAEFTPKAIGVK